VKRRHAARVESQPSPCVMEIMANERWPLVVKLDQRCHHTMKAGPRHWSRELPFSGVAAGRGDALALILDGLAITGKNISVSPSD
jgi:hypothetical protein